MDHDSEELSRERAASSEPCSTRPNPFDDDDATSARKRQRRGSRSTSADTTMPITTPDSMSQREETASSESESAPPRTPPRHGIQLPPSNPTSSKVTINLRTDRASNSTPSAPASPTAPPKMAHEEAEISTNNLQDNARESVESESDALSTVPAMETPDSTASSEPGSPAIEFIAIDDEDSDYDRRSPGVRIYQDTAMGELDPVPSFPYHCDGESLAGCVRRLAQHLQYGTFVWTNYTYTYTFRLTLKQRGSKTMIASPDSQTGLRSS